MTKRPSFEQACRMYVHRFTMENVPSWASRPCGGKYYAPQFASDREWYDNTKFPGEPDHFLVDSLYCYTRNQTWPLGEWLHKPYRKGEVPAPAAPKVPRGFTHTEVEYSTKIDGIDTLIDYLQSYSEQCDGFLDGEHLFQVVAETLTDGSVKRSVRICRVE